MKGKTLSFEGSSSSSNKTTTGGLQGGGIGFPQLPLGAMLQQGQLAEAVPQYQSSFSSLGMVISQVSAQSPFSAMTTPDLEVSPEVSSHPEVFMVSIRGQIGKHASRLGWGVNEIQQYLADQFGKSRSQLTDDDLILLLYRLQQL